MRRETVSLLLLLAAACGGPASTTTPPPAGTPTTMVLVAGDGQSAQPGSTLPTKLSVLVKDAANAPVAGVVVHFSVTSGGGTIAAASATTGTDGIATSGDWTIGSSAGTNVVSATVTGLSPVTFTATGTTTGSQVLIAATVAPTGGEFTLNRPGDPLNGLTLTVPSPGFGTIVLVEVRTAGSTGVPSKPGVRIASPVITVASNTSGPARGGVRLKVPASIAAGEWPIAYVFDPASGAYYTAMVAPSGNGTVMVVLPGLDQTGLDVPVAGGLMAGFRSPPIPGEVAINIVIGAVPLTELAKDLNTGYVPANDDWEFDYALSTLSTDLRFAPGMGLSAAWYYDHFKAARGKLNRKYQKAAGVEWSNPEGLALAALTRSEIASTIDAIVNYGANLSFLAASAGLPLDSIRLLSLKAGIYTTGRPQLLFAGNIVNDTVQLEGVSLLVYATRGSTLDISAGTSIAGVNGPRSITLSNGTFPPITWAYKSPILLAYEAPLTLTSFIPLGPTAGVSAAKLNSLWNGLFNGTILNNFRQFKMISTISRTLTDTLFMPGDTVRFWFESTCDDGYTPGPDVTPQAPMGGGSLFRRFSNGTWEALGANPAAPFGNAVYGNGLQITDTIRSGIHLGAALLCARPGGASDKGRYAGWMEFSIKNRSVTISPNPLAAFWNTPFTLRASSEYPAPPQATWVWDLGDGRTLTTTTDTIRVTWSDPTNSLSVDYPVRVTVKSGGVPFAGGRSVIKLRPLQIAWRFTAAALNSAQLPPGGIGGEKSDTTINTLFNGWSQSLSATPLNSLLFLFHIQNPKCRALYLEQFPPGQFAPVLDSTFLGAIKAFLGSDCPPDPSFTWSLTMGTLGSGTLVASAVNIPLPDEITLPGGSVNATMSGTTLAGTLVWRVRYSSGIALYTFNFQATQVLPVP